MTFSIWILIAVSLMELVLLLAVIVFFLRLRRSESLLNQLHQRQEKLLANLHFNAELEQELMSSFAQRQAELAELDRMLEARSRKLEQLVARAEEMSSSPQFLRETILRGKRQGKTVFELAKATGLTTDEVELILMKG